MSVLLLSTSWVARIYRCEPLHLAIFHLSFLHLGKWRTVFCCYYCWNHRTYKQKMSFCKIKICLQDFLNASSHHKVLHFNDVFILYDWQNECYKKILRIKYLICYCIYANSFLSKWESSSEALFRTKKIHWECVCARVCVCIHLLFIQ
jgi:hypothetical protein